MRTTFDAVSRMRIFGLGLAAILVACSANDESAKGGGAGGPGGENSANPDDPNNPETKDPTNPDAPPAPLVENIAVTDVAFFQGVKVLVVKGGEKVAKRNAPVVVARPGLLRVYVTPQSGWAAREVTGELRITAGGKKLPILRDTKTISAASKDEDIKTTFNFELTAEMLPADATFQVALTASDGVKVEGESDARWPKDGSFADVGAQVSGKLKIVVVPVKYDTDGSGRVPDVSAGQIERYKQTFMARYPASEVEITTHAPFPWTTTIAGNGTGFSSILRAITQLRQTERPAKDVYYYGALAPTSSMGTFCGGGCVTGLSTVVENPGTSSMRASVGVGFPGQESANTMAHEVGHAHGREHAPCGGANGVDPSFPYQGATIGVWGYNIFTKVFISPTKGRDMMGYCPNEWVSDYTYAALFTRIATIATEKPGTTTPTTPGTGGSSNTFQVATVTSDGSLVADGDLDLSDDELAEGEAHEATFVSSSGLAVAKSTARYFHFDHLPGGFVVLPKDVTAAYTQVKISGFAKALVRDSSLAKH
jgi:hypothetical protein